MCALCCRYLALVSSTVRKYLFPCRGSGAIGPQMLLLMEIPVVSVSGRFVGAKPLFGTFTAG